MCCVVILFVCVVLLCVCCLSRSRCISVVVVQVRQNKDVSKCNSVGIVIHKVISKLWIV